MWEFISLTMYFPINVDTFVEMFVDTFVEMLTFYV